MVNYQIVALAGNLTKDVQVFKNTVAKFTLALNTGWGENKKSLFLNCVCFSKQHSEKVWGLLTGLKKGTNVGVQGQLTPNSYEKDGKTITTIELVVNRFDIYSPKVVAEGDAVKDVAVKATPAHSEEEDVEIPF